VTAAGEVKRARLCLWAIAAVPCLVVLDTLVALLRGWRPATSDMGFVLAAAVAALLVALLAYRRSAVRGFLARRAPELVLALFAVAFAWASVEAAMRLLGLDVEYYHRTFPHDRRLFRPNPEWMPGIEGESWFTANSQGIRGPELPAREQAERILCVGGSTTANLYLDDSETWTRLLMDRLHEAGGPFWVGDVGMSGYASWQHLKFFQTSGLLDEMDQVVALVGVNDAMRAIRGTSLVINTAAAPLWERSLVLKRARLAIRARLRRDETMVETPDGSAYVARRQQRREAEIVDALPDLTAALRGYQENLRAMLAIAREKGVRLVLATQPVLWTAGLPERAQQLLWLGRLDERHFLSVEKAREAMDLFNAALLEVCADSGVDCVDLSGMHGREEYYFDDVHYSEAGAAEVARRIAEELARGRP